MEHNAGDTRGFKYEGHFCDMVFYHSEMNQREIAKILVEWIMED